MSNVINIKKIINNQTIISPTPANRRDFQMPLFLFNGNQVNGVRLNYFEDLSDVIDTYGSNSEPTKAASSYFAGGFNGLKPVKIMIGNVASSETLANVLAEVMQDPRFYYLAIDNAFSVADNQTLASLCEAATKIRYMAAVLTDDPNVAAQDLATDTTSIAKLFYNAGYKKTFVHYDDANLVDEYKQMADISYFCTVNFTAARKLGTLAFKQFNALSPTPLTDPDAYAQNMLDKNCNFYAPFGEVGREIAYKGVVPEGGQIRTYIGIDWIDYNLTYNIFDLLTSVHQIGYNTGDFSLLYSAIAKAFEQAKAFDFVKPGTDVNTGKEYPLGYDIQIPDPNDVSSSDKQQGTLSGIICEALVNGAVVKFDLTTILKF